MKFSLNITSSYCGYDSKFANENILCIIQDCISILFEEIKCSNIILKNDYNAMWVFSKNKVKLLSKPYCTQEVNVNCRIVKMTHALCYIKTDIYSKDNTKLIEGVTECCILDKTTYRLQKLNKFNLILEEENCDVIFNFEEKDYENEESVFIHPIFCDMSLHLNNAKSLYLLMLKCDRKDLDYLNEHPFEVQIKYQGQAFIESTPTLKLLSKDHNIYYRLEESQDNQKILQIGQIKIL